MLFPTWTSFFTVGDDPDVDWLVSDVSWAPVMLRKCSTLFPPLNRYAAPDKTFYTPQFCFVTSIPGYDVWRHLDKGLRADHQTHRAAKLNWSGVVANLSLLLIGDNKGAVYQIEWTTKEMTPNVSRLQRCNYTRHARFSTLDTNIAVHIILDFGSYSFGQARLFQGGQKV